MPRAGIEPTTRRFHDWRSTTELPRQLQWDGQSLNTDYQAFAPRPLGLGITSVDRQATRSSDQMLISIGNQYSNSAQPTVVASVAQWQSASHEIGESWVRFPLVAPDFFPAFVLLFFSKTHQSFSL